MTNESLSSLRSGLKRMVIRECNVKNVAPEQIGDEDQIIGGTGTLSLDTFEDVILSTVILHDLPYD